MKHLWLSLAALVAACSSPAASADKKITSIYWSDGDSGRVDGISFRLADVDAPETGGVGAAIGAAECERERSLGFKAKEFMVSMTRGADLKITHQGRPDRYGRVVMRISADGQDVAKAGLKSGVLKRWPHRGAKALSPKPDWCR